MISKKVLILAAIVAGIAVALAVVAALWKPNTENLEPGNKAKGPQQVQVLQRTDLAEKEMPLNIPKDLPIESGAKILENFTEKTTSGDQSTRVYVSTKSLDDVYKNYTNYFKLKSWTVMSTINEPKLKMILAKKENIKLQMTISENSVTKQRIVNISATY